MRSGFSTLTLAYWIDSLVRVSRRDSRSHFGKVARRPLKLVCCFARWLKASPGRAAGLLQQSNFTLPLAHDSSATSVTWPQTAYEVLEPQPSRLVYACKSNANDYSSTTFFSTISSLLTLFSKFFSPFLRSTCSLSVSHKYLALEEVYLPFRAAIPNNPTLR